MEIGKVRLAAFIFLTALLLAPSAFAASATYEANCTSRFTDECNPTGVSAVTGFFPIQCSYNDGLPANAIVESVSVESHVRTISGMLFYSFNGDFFGTYSGSSPACNAPTNTVFARNDPPYRAQQQNTITISANWLDSGSIEGGEPVGLSAGKHLKVTVNYSLSAPANTKPSGVTKILPSVLEPGTRGVNCTARIIDAENLALNYVATLLVNGAPNATSSGTIQNNTFEPVLIATAIPLSQGDTLQCKLDYDDGALQGDTAYSEIVGPLPAPANTPPSGTTTISPVAPSPGSVDISCTARIIDAENLALNYVATLLVNGAPNAASSGTIQNNSLQPVLSAPNVQVAQGDLLKCQLDYEDGSLPGATAYSETTVGPGSGPGGTCGATVPGTGFCDGGPVSNFLCGSISNTACCANATSCKLVGGVCTQTGTTSALCSDFKDNQAGCQAFASAGCSWRAAAPSCGAISQGSGQCSPRTGAPSMTCTDLGGSDCCQASGSYCQWSGTACNYNSPLPSSGLCHSFDNNYVACTISSQFCTWSATTCGMPTPNTGWCFALPGKTMTCDKIGSFDCCQKANPYCLWSGTTSCTYNSAPPSSDFCRAFDDNYASCRIAGDYCYWEGKECSNASGSCQSPRFCCATSGLSCGKTNPYTGNKMCCLADNSSTACNYGSECCSGICDSHVCQPSFCDVVPTIPSYTDVTLNPENGSISTYTYNLSEENYTKTGLPNALLFMVNLTDQSNIQICYDVADSSGHMQMTYDPTAPGCTDYWYIFCPRGDASTSSGLKSREICLNSTNIDYNKLIYPQPVPCAGATPPAPKSYLDHILSHNELYFCNKVTKDYAPLCWPLMLILGLLLGASFAAGKNPFQSFDFSSPRMNRGRQYSARVQNKSFDLMSYLMSVGSTAASFVKGKTKDEKAKMAEAKGKVKEAKQNLKDGKGTKADVKTARAGVGTARQGIRDARQQKRQTARKEKYDSSDHKTGMGKFLHNVGAFVGVRDKGRPEPSKDQKKKLIDFLKPVPPKDAFSTDTQQRSTATSSTGQVNMVVSPHQIRKAKRASIAALNKKIKEAKTPEEKKALRQERHALRQDFRSMRQNYGVDPNALEKKGMKIEDGKLKKVNDNIDMKKVITNVTDSDRFSSAKTLFQNPFGTNQPAKQNVLSDEGKGTQFGFTKSKETVLSMITSPGEGKSAESQSGSKTGSSAQVRQPTTGTSGAQATSMSATDILGVGISMFSRGFWSKEGMANRMKATGVDEFFKEASGATVGAALVILLRFVLKKMMENAKLRDAEKGKNDGSRVKTNLRFTSPTKAITSLFRIYAVMSSLSSFVKGLGAATGSKSLSGGIGFIEGVNSINIGGIGKYNLNVAELATWVDPSLRETYVGGGSSAIPYPFNMVQTAVSGALVGGDVLVQKASDALKRDVKLAFVQGGEAFLVKVDESGNILDKNGKDVMKEGSGQPFAYKKINVKTGEATDCAEVIGLSQTKRTYVVVNEGSSPKETTYSAMGAGAASFYDNTQRDRAETYFNSNSFVYSLKSQYGGSSPTKSLVKNQDGSYVTKITLIEDKVNTWGVARNIPDLASLDGKEAAKYVSLRNACEHQVQLINTFLGVINGKDALDVISRLQDRVKINDALESFKNALKQYESVELGKLTSDDKRSMSELEDKVSTYGLALVVFDAMGSSPLDISKDVFDKTNATIEQNIIAVIGFTNSYLNCYSQAIATGNDDALLEISKFRKHGVENLQQDTAVLNSMATAMQYYGIVHFNNAKAEKEYLSGLKTMVDAGSNLMTNASDENTLAFAQATDKLCETMIKGVSFEGRFGSKEKDLKKLLENTNKLLEDINISHKAGNEKYSYTDDKGTHEIEYKDAVQKCTAALFTVLQTTVSLHQTSNSYLNAGLAASGWQNRPAYQVSPEADALNRLPAPAEASGERNLSRGFYSPSFNLNSISNVKYGPGARFNISPAISIEAAPIEPIKKEGSFLEATQIDAKPNTDSEPKSAKLDYARTALTSQAALDQSTHKRIETVESRFNAAEQSLANSIGGIRSISPPKNIQKQINNIEKEIQELKKDPLNEDNVQRIEYYSQLLRQMHDAAIPLIKKKR